MDLKIILVELLKATDYLFLSKILLLHSQRGGTGMAEGPCGPDARRMDGGMRWRDGRNRHNQPNAVCQTMRNVT